MAVWSRLLYCPRCDHVSDTARRLTAPSGNMHDLLTDPHSHIILSTDTEKQTLMALGAVIGLIFLYGFAIAHLQSKPPAFSQWHEATPQASSTSSAEAQSPLPPATHSAPAIAPGEINYAPPSALEESPGVPTTSPPPASSTSSSPARHVCPTCHGTGKIRCQECEGTGRCAECGGSGRDGQRATC